MTRLYDLDNNFSTLFLYLKKNKKQGFRYSLMMLLLLTSTLSWSNNNLLENDFSNNTSEREVLMDTLDLAMTISTPTPAACNTNEVTYTIQVINQGAFTAHNIEITNYIPDGMSLAPTGNADWVLNGNVAKRTLTDPLTGGGFTTLFITLLVDPNPMGTELINIAEISFADDDTDPNNMPPLDFDSFFDDIIDNDSIGADNVVDNTNGDEDDHDFATLPLLILNAMANETQAVCNFDNGEISITPDTYMTYNWSDGGTGADRTSLFAGLYTVTVTGNFGCTIIVDSIEVTNDCSLCPASAGTVTPMLDSICLIGDSTIIEFTDDGNSVLPPGYITAYFLTTGPEQTIQYFDTVQQFVVTQPGTYDISIKVFDVLHIPQEEIDSMQLGVTQLDFVGSFLAQNGGYLCGELSTQSATVVVESCVTMDTVLFTLEVDSVGTYCFDGLPGPFSNNTTTTLCDGSTSGSDGIYGSYVVQETGCIVYTSNGIPGNNVDTICLIVTDDLGNSDTTIFIPTLICHTPPSIVNVACDPNTMTGDFCLDIPLGEIGDYLITIDNVPMQNGFTGCDSSDVVSYDYSTLFGSGTLGPYTLDSWSVNGQVQSAGFNSIQELIDSMNVWDPMSNWSFDPLTTTIFGGLNSQVYGDLVITHVVTTTQVTYSPVVLSMAMGSNINLNEGSYLVVIAELGANCAQESFIVNVSCSACPGILSMDTLQMVSPNCNLPTDVCIDISTANIFNYNVLLDGSSYAGIFTSCDFSGVNDGTVLQMSDGTHELIVIETATGCADTMTIIIDCAGCPDLIPDMQVLQDMTCSDPMMVCINVPMAELGDYTIMDNGGFYNGSILSCNVTDVAIGLDTGFHEVVLLNNVSGCSDTMMVTIECVPNMIVIDTTIAVMEGGTLCLDSMMIGDVSSVSFTCGDTTINTTVNYVFDTLTNCIVFEGTTVGSDTLCFRLFNLAGDQTDVMMTINVTQTCATEIITQETAFLEISDCAAMAEICIDVPLDQVTNYIVNDNGTAYNNTFAGCDFDTTLAYSYFTLPAQGAMGPYNVDAWDINGTVFSGEFLTISDLVDSMNVWDAPGTWTLDSTNLIISGGNAGSTYGDISITQVATNAFALLNLNTNLFPNGTVLFLGEGGHEIVFLDIAANCSDTLQVFVNCISGTIVYDTITVGDSSTYCVDTTNLVGNIDTIYNSCPMLSGEYAIFEIVDSSFCVNYGGVDIGVDTACIVICDDLGICDSTIIIVTVEPLASNFPVANNDTDTTMMDNNIVFDFLGNDSINGILDTFYVLDNPTFGNVILNPDGTASYNPNTGYCDENTPDQFTYVLCNEYGCDTATVFIYVLCNDPSDFRIYNGFSPNGDGTNDVFYIQGVESYPDNVLCIYNRWGNQVFRQDGYNNTWGGEFKNTILPNGTYFYVFDNGQGETFSGYVQLQR